MSRRRTGRSRLKVPKVEQIAALLGAAGVVRELSRSRSPHPRMLQMEQKGPPYDMDVDRPRKGSTVVKVDGTSAGTKVMTTRKRKRRRGKGRGRTVKQQVKALRSLIPKVSYKLFRDFYYLQMRTTAHTERRVYDINCYSRAYIEGLTDKLTAVDTTANIDYNASNTSIQMSRYYKLMIKNNTTGNQSVKYAFVVCKDDDTESPTKSIKEGLEDRGYTVADPQPSATASAGVSVFTPSYLLLDSGNFWAPVFSVDSLRRKWNVGTVQTATIGPGDTFDCIWSQKKYTYKPEIHDQENFLYMSGVDVRLLIEVFGDLGHDATAHALVGRSSHHFDCEAQIQTNIRYSNPKGLREVVYSDTANTLGVGDIVHADNVASVVEPDAV